MKPVDLDLLIELFDHMAYRVEGPVTYKWGAKAPSLTCDSAEIESIDCSGFSRYVIARATDQRIIAPDGSVAQHQWCLDQELKRVPYIASCILAVPWDLYIAFILPTSNHPNLRHVWLCYRDPLCGGITMESHGGVGVSSRRWDTPILLKRCSACFKVPTTKES